MKALALIIAVTAGSAIWYIYVNPKQGPDEGARILAEAAERNAANMADIEARSAMVADLKAKAEADKAAEEQSSNTSLAQDDVAMARERLRSWREKTSGK